MVNIYEHDLTGAAPTTYDMLTLNGNGATMLHVLCDGNNVLANYGNYTYILDASFLYESRLSHVTATEGMDGYNEQFDLMLQSDSPDIEGIPWGTFWTPTVHNLLAAPVTKTVANTMKITYTFTLEILDMVPLIPV